MSAAFWDGHVPAETRRHEDDPEAVVYERVMLAFLRGFVSSDDRVLDVGGGPGRFSLAIAPLVKQVEHVDFAPKMVEAAAERAKRSGIDNIAFAVADARDLSRYPDRSFTKVLSINTPIAFSAERWGDALDEMCRVTAGEAVFTASTFLSCLAALLDASVAAGAGWSPVVDRFAGERLMEATLLRQIGHEWPSYRAFAPGELEQALEERGFEVVAVRGLAVLCRLMKRESVAAVVEDEALFARFISVEEQVAALYGRWAPSRELLFHVRRKA